MYRLSPKTALNTRLNCRKRQRCFKTRNRTDYRLTANSGTEAGALRSLDSLPSHPYNMPTVNGKKMNIPCGMRKRKKSKRENRVKRGNRVNTPLVIILKLNIEYSLIVFLLWVSYLHFDNSTARNPYKI